jgi:hypothetical protein
MPCRWTPNNNAKNPQHSGFEQEIDSSDLSRQLGLYVPIEMRFLGLENRKLVPPASPSSVAGSLWLLLQLIWGIKKSGNLRPHFEIRANRVFSE